MIWHKLHCTWQVVCVLTALAWSVGQFYKDSSFLCGLMFYIPSPALVATYLISAVYALPKKNRAWKLYAVLLLAPLAWVLLVENHWQAAKSPVVLRIERRLVHWNICRPFSRWPQQLELLRSLNADVIVLSEITDAVQDADFPGYRILRRHEMLIACRGEMVSSSSLISGRVLDAFLVTCDLPEGELRVIMADMTSNVEIPRDPYLQPFVQKMAELNTDIVTGDFNAPRRSLAFLELPPGFRHAYNEAGGGWGYTWPMPVPALAIDQCVCGPDLIPVKYQLRSTILSDHRIQILDFGKRSWE